MKVIYLVLLLLLTHQCAFVGRYQNKDSAIKVNQLGFNPDGMKVAIVVSPRSETFEVKDASDQVVYQGQVMDSKYWELSNEEAAVIDFSDFTQSGDYYIQCADSRSVSFPIEPTPYEELIKASAKSYYYNRASMQLEEEYAGVFERPFAHSDTAVIIHQSAADDFNLAGDLISTPFGWYDAGDYNKYIVNSGITTYTLLMAYQHNRNLFDSLTWNIPESSNRRADLLDEVLWNISWMETMQDPDDGGVYHKTTTAQFEGFKKAAEATSPRFVAKKGTAASLDFSAVMARASIIFQESDSLWADQLLNKSKKAWKWANEHADVVFKNPVSDDPEFPSIKTGEYGDGNFRDEFFWAGVELYLATGDEGYLQQSRLEDFNYFSVPNWGSVEVLGLISLVSSDLNNSLKKRASEQLRILADQLITQWRQSPYRITMDKFFWGSNSEILNQSMVLLNAFKVVSNAEYFEAAVSGLDYVLGRNATGYCFVTGLGAKSPMNIHHRQSAADNIEEPIPGLLVGGPNPRNIHQDCGSDSYPDQTPAKCYLDEVCSYSTNEVAINWNAPLVYVSASVQSIYSERFPK